MRRFTAALFLLGLAVLVAAIYQQMNLVVTPLAGDAINASAGQQVGAGNIVTAVVLAFRGFDTLLELTILFTAATAGGDAGGRFSGRCGTGGGLFYPGAGATGNHA